MQRLGTLVGPRITCAGTSKTKRISTKGIDFLEPYIAKLPLGTGVGNPPELVYYPCMLPHEVLAHLVANIGMVVKHAGCMGTTVDPKAW